MVGMNTPVRFMLWFAGALIVFGAVVVIALKLFIDPNDYRDEIAAAVEKSTGRTLTIEGDLSLQIFPAIAVQLGPLELSNPPGFESPRMLRVEHASVSVQLLPLIFSQELAVGVIAVDGLDVSLETYADGRSNLVFGEVPEGDGASNPGREPTAGEQQPDAGLPELDIAGVRISGGRIHYIDEVAGDDIQISQLSVITDAISDGERFSLEASLQVEGLAPETQVALALVAGVTADMASATADMQSLDVQLSAVSPDVPGGKADLDIQVQQVMGLGAEDITVNDLVALINAAGLTIRATAKGGLYGSDPALSGELSIDEFSPRDLLATLGEPPMQTADPAVLQVASLIGEWALEGDAATLSSLSLKLDDSTATGLVGLTSLERESIEFDLQFDRLDVDRYSEPVVEEARPDKGQAGSGVAPAQDDAIDLPMEELRVLDLQGRLGFGELRVAKARLTDVDLTMNAQDGLIRLHPLTADIYEGTYTDDITLNVQNEAPRVSLKSELQGFQIGPFLADTEDFENLTGLASLKLNLRTRGKTERAITRNLNGRAGLELDKARYIGKDLWYEIRAAKDAVKGDKSPPPPENAYTDISEFSGSARIQDGVASNKDFVALVPFLRLTGAGDINLVKSTLDYKLEATVTSSCLLLFP